MSKQKGKIRVGITMGDPSGIGAAITAKALSYLKPEAEFTVIGDAWVFEKSKIPACPAGRQNPKSKKFNFVDLKNVNRVGFEFGKVRAEYGWASIEYLDKALELLRNKELDCLVTCPISKEAVKRASLRYAGHTEYFSEKTHTKDLVMMLLNRRIRFSLATRHIPLSCVSQALAAARLSKTILMTYHALRILFLLKHPRLVVCGLNPHASDNGVIGWEENKLVKPVLKKLKNKIKDLEGPLASDVAIARAFQGSYDAVIAMYHDQALIPLKLFRENFGVNMTLGLPFVRTSPLHGTAFDIAKKRHLADPCSLIEAIRLAIKCTLNQRRDSARISW
ncbi:MAG: 4-hydroxythreonine-4-phosphate dehydrogenase PdxA [Candidatus Omnitrophota bacterium]